MPATLHTPEALSGRWQLVSFELRDEDGNVSRPWGDAVSGMLILAADDLCCFDRPHQITGVYSRG